MATYWGNSCSFGLRYVSWCEYLIVSLVFSHLGFWSGNLFLIAPFPDLCLLVPFLNYIMVFVEALIPELNQSRNLESRGNPVIKSSLWQNISYILDNFILYLFVCLFVLRLNVPVNGANASCV